MLLDKFSNYIRFVKWGISSFNRYKIRNYDTYCNNVRRTGMLKPIKF